MSWTPGCVERRIEKQFMTERPAQEFHIAITDPSRSLIEQLESATDLGRQQLKQAVDKGVLWLERGKTTRRLRRIKSPLKTGDTLHFYYNAEVLAQVVEPAQLISDQGDYSVWYKPFGMHSQGSKWGDHTTVTRSVEKQTQRTAFLIHRLDRAATGLMLIAHKKTTAALLAALFAERRIEKRYLAIVEGLYPALGNSVTLDTPIDGKPSISHVQTLEQDTRNNRSLLGVHIETGRKHQIRRHLAESGYPIVGDRLHGNATDSDTDNLQLCSYSAKFICPVSGQTQHFTLPDTFKPSL